MSDDKLEAKARECAEKVLHCPDAMRTDDPASDYEAHESWGTKCILTAFRKVALEAKIELANQAAISPDVVLALTAELRAVKEELADLRRGEFICRKCGLRKDSEPCDTGGHF